jgi:hypothetical protein
MHTVDWSVRISIEEDDDRNTHAHAVLTSRDGATLHSDGRARRNPGDAPVPEIGDELAAARALYGLADLLMDVAGRDVENLTHPA